MIVWPVTSSRPITANSRTALTQSGQPQTTLSGVRTMKSDQDDDLEPEAAEAGAALGFEVVALVLDGAGRRAGGAAASGRRSRAGTIRDGGQRTRRTRRAAPAPTPPGAAPWRAPRRPRPRAARARIAGVEMTFHDRDPPPRMIRSRSMTRASTQIGRSAGSPNTVTPPISIPVMLARRLGRARRTPCGCPSRSRTARFTSSRYGASVTQAAYRGGSDLPITRIVLADSSGEKP